MLHLFVKLPHSLSYNIFKNKSSLYTLFSMPSVSLRSKKLRSLKHNTTNLTLQYNVNSYSHSKHHRHKIAPPLSQFHNNNKSNDSDSIILPRLYLKDSKLRPLIQNLKSMDWNTVADSNLTNSVFTVTALAPTTIRRWRPTTCHAKISTYITSSADSCWEFLFSTYCKFNQISNISLNSKYTINKVLQLLKTFWIESQNVFFNK